MHPRAAPLHRIAAAAAAATVTAPGQKPLHLGQPRFWSAASPAEPAQAATEAGTPLVAESPAKAVAVVAGAEEGTGAAKKQAVPNSKVPDASRMATRGSGAAADSPAQGKRKRTAGGSRRAAATADVGATESLGDGAAAQLKGDVAAASPAAGHAAASEASRQSGADGQEVSAAVPSAAEALTVAAVVPATASAAAAQPLVPTLFAEEGGSSDSEGSLPEIDSGSDTDSE